MGRVYEIAWDAATAISAQIDVFEVQPADDKPVSVHGFRVWQTSDLRDVEEEIIGLQLLRGLTTSGSGGGTPTKDPHNPNDTAAGFTAECRNTTLATTGTAKVVFGDAWNVRAPYAYDFLPEDRPTVSQAETLIVLRLMAAPADALTMFASMTVEELV